MPSSAASPSTLDSRAQQQQQQPYYASRRRSDDSFASDAVYTSHYTSVGNNIHICLDIPPPQLPASTCAPFFLNASFLLLPLFIFSSKKFLSSNHFKNRALPKRTCWWPKSSGCDKRRGARSSRPRGPRRRQLHQHQHVCESPAEGGRGIETAITIRNNHFYLFIYLIFVLFLSPLDVSVRGEFWQWSNGSKCMRLGPGGSGSGGGHWGSFHLVHAVRNNRRNTVTTKRTCF